MVARVAAGTSPRRFPGRETSGGARSGAGACRRPADLEPRPQRAVAQPGHLRASPDVVRLAVGLPVSRSTCVSSRYWLHSAHLRQAACHSRSGDTRRIN